MRASGWLETVSLPWWTSGSSFTSTVADALPPTAIDWVTSLKPSFFTLTRRCPMSTVTGLSSGDVPTFSSSTKTSAPGSLTVTVSFTVNDSMASSSALASRRSASVRRSLPVSRYWRTSAMVLA